MIRFSLDEGAVAPTRAHEDDAGIDIATWHDFAVGPFAKHVVNTGVHVQVPEGHVGLLFVRSSVGINRHITLANGTGIIDAGYTGPIMLALQNNYGQSASFKAGERIAQLVIVPCNTGVLMQVDSLEDTERGEGGIGSTGV